MRNTPQGRSCFRAKCWRDPSAFQRVRFEIFEGDELERGSVSGFKVDGRGPIVIERGFPARHADTPFVAGFESGETPFRMGRDQIISIEHREIEKLTSDAYADRVQAEIFRAGATKSVAIKPGQWIAAAAFQFGSENIGGHSTINPVRARSTTAKINIYTASTRFA